MKQASNLQTTMKKTITICGRVWSVVPGEGEHQEGRRGATFKELQEIRINPSLHPDLKETTLIHEILHACADFVGVEDEKLSEEDWIKRISPVLTRVLKDNPNLL